MADFWDYATEGFNRGVPLGVRTAERGQDLKIEQDRWNKDYDLRKDEADRSKERHGLQMKTAKIELGEKEEKQRQTNFRRSFVMAKALADTGDEEAAGTLISQAYTKLVNNGDEAQFIYKKHSPENKIWKTAEGKDAEVLMLSRQHGLVPYKSLKDVLKVLEPYAMDSDKLIEYEREERNKLDERNAGEKPFRAKDGKLYVKKWTMERSGLKSEDVPYTGQEPMSATEQQLRDIDAIPDNLLSKEGKKIKLGLMRPSSQAELIKAQADLIEAKSRAGGGGGAKDATGWATFSKERRSQLKDAFEWALKPFVSKGKPVLDPETGDMTATGDNGLAVARKIISKDPATLSAEEKANLPYAKRAVEVYDTISGAVLQPYAKPKEGREPAPQDSIESEAKRRGLVKDSSGRWVKPAKKERRGLTTP